MCGITGIMAFNLVGKFNKIHITAATMSLARRGPDFQDIYVDDWVGLGHRRLSIIDISEKANQPMWDDSRRYSIVYNGEIFNFRELKREMEEKGIHFNTQSDTEVLLQLFIREKEQCLQRLNGFFAFCIYDRQQQSFFIARDRFGVKPLLYLHDEDKFIFASEMKTLLQYGIDKSLDYTSLFTYLQLNYIPAPDTIFRHVKKLLPGHYMNIRRGQVETNLWYTIPYDQHHAETSSITYTAATRKFLSLFEQAVQDRLVADVPLGAFLSGGIDSSAVTAVASRHKPDLQTFSIGFRDEKFFDETAYATLVARHLKTEHTIFSLSNDALYEHVHSILDYIDEPFADSSAINVFILSRETRKHATVALSGDGADELLGGYNKHEALNRMLQPGWKEKAVASLLPLWNVLPQSRNNRATNLVRQAARFGKGFRLTGEERYWQWAAYADSTQVKQLLTEDSQRKAEWEEYHQRKGAMLKLLPFDHTLNNILLTDMHLVLQNDMLVKLDSMSMANGLEVRPPFLDYRLVNFAFTLPASFKITGSRRKRILQDAFKGILPPELYHRPKKGFEVPLLKWLRHEMKSLISEDLLSRSRIEEEGVFHYPEVDRLKRKLFSRNPGDTPARIWALLVFQWWFRKYGK
jgi:asparagine synthase (glutamine-hydrolysing)